MSRTDSLRNLTIVDLRAKIANLKELLRKDESALRVLCEKCDHEWSVEYDPIIRRGYHFPGDPPNTMGVDRQLPYDVPETRTPRWIRTCKRCGVCQETSKTETLRKPGEIIGTVLMTELPDFKNSPLLIEGIEK